MNSTSATPTGNGYDLLVSRLDEWGITLYSGVTGGGVIHFLKHFPPFDADVDGRAALFTLGEYSAGFVPLGYHLASGKMAAAVATSGAATKLLTCGLSDAKLHDIPAVYLVPLSGAATEGLAPLQDTTRHGSNVVEQLRAECPDGVFLLDNISTLASTLTQARRQLDNAKPVVLVLMHEALVERMPASSPPLSPPEPAETDDIAVFLTQFRQAVSDKHLVILVGEEMARYKQASQMTEQLCQVLHAKAIWSINGANAVSRSNPYGYGYISFGGNDSSLSLYENLGENDVLMILGACPDEYTANLKKFSAANTFYLSNIRGAYGQIDNSFSHFATGEYHHVHAPLDSLLRSLTDEGRSEPFGNIPADIAPDYLNALPLTQPEAGYVNMAELYQRLDAWWPENSLGFDDVCLAYKDRQYVTQRPNDRIRFFSLYRGSAMGGAFGAAIGARLASPNSAVFVFTGDGCFRLFAGSMGEARDLGLTLFLLNNSRFSIVEQGLTQILPDVDPRNYHAEVRPLDYCALARASGWQAERLAVDLSNLHSLLAKCRTPGSVSMLIEVLVDPAHVLGTNPRVKNL